MSSVIEDFTCIYSLKLHVFKSGIENYIKSKHVYKLILIIKEFINNS